MAHPVHGSWLPPPPGMSGDDRYVVDYLAEEVLQRQPGRVQAFLLQTSILGRLSGPLCDVVTGQDDGKAMLAALDSTRSAARPKSSAASAWPMAALLKAAAKHGKARNYVRRLLAAVSDAEHDRPVKQALIDPLSERELDVLRLLGSELDGPAIARELTVSLNTVRTHTKHIYAKLAVTNRRAAVRRAQEIDLLPGTRGRQP